MLLLMGRRRMLIRKWVSLLSLLGIRGAAFGFFQGGLIVMVLSMYRAGYYCFFLYKSGYLDAMVLLEASAFVRHCSSGMQVLGFCTLVTPAQEFVFSFTKRVIKQENRGTKKRILGVISFFRILGLWSSMYIHFVKKN
jgi:hypothetical protein